MRLWSADASRLCRPARTSSLLTTGVFRAFPASARRGCLPRRDSARLSGGALYALGPSRRFREFRPPEERGFEYERSWRTSKARLFKALVPWGLFPGVSRFGEKTAFGERMEGSLRHQRPQGVGPNLRHSGAFAGGDLDGRMVTGWVTAASEGIRTLDLNLGKGWSPMNIADEPRVTGDPGKVNYGGCVSPI